MTDSLFEAGSEVAVLAGILKTPDLIHSLDGLRYFMFSSTPYQTLFKEFEDLMEMQLLPDPTLVYNSLESKNLLDVVGGKKMFEIIIEKEVNPEAVPHLAKLVMDSYKARSLLSISAGIKKEALTPSNIDDTISNIKKSLSSLMEVGGGSTTLHLGDLAKNAYEEIVERANNPGIRGHSWGNKHIDKATGGKSPGDLWVIAGRPGMGKTASVINSILEDGKNGVPSLLIEREMRGQELTERLISLDTGIPNTNIRLGLLNTSQLKQVYDSLTKLKTYPIYIDTSYHSSDPYYLESIINKYKNKFGVQIVYLDYLQILAERDDTQTQEIGKLTRMFKLICNDLNLCSVLLSQLNRNVESRENKRPLLSDMRQSGSIEEDADFVIGLYRDEVYNQESKYKNLMEYIILKHRNGPPGTVTVGFNGPTNKIEE